MNTEILREKLLVNEGETRAWAMDLAGSLSPGDVLALVGDLGTGKTTLTKYIAEGLGIRRMITSPTFTIVNEYHDPVTLYHFDAYRLEDEEEAFERGLEEYLKDPEAICIIEWPERIEGLLPENTKIIYLEYGNQENERIAGCTF